MKKSFCAEHDLAFSLKRQYGREPARFVDELLKRPLAALTDDGYVKECAILQSESFPEVLLARPDDLPKRLELLFPDGDRCCVAAIPFMAGGYSKADLGKEEWEDFLSHYRHITALSVGFSGITQGYDDVPARYFGILPPRLRADISEGGCTFKIDYPEKGKVDGARNRESFAGLYAKAYANLRKFLIGGLASQAQSV